MSLVNTLRPVLEAVPAVRLAVVFGSEARASASAGSDVDIGISGELASTDLGSLSVSLERLLGRRVDLVALDAAPPLLRFQVARDGHVIFEREPYAWADFRARAMIDWWDWQPTVAMVRRVLAERLREEARDGPR